jgi:Zn-dependent protease/CBS domain-containing protein
MQIVRLFGTPVRIDWSWLVGFALLAWTFSAAAAGLLALALIVALFVHEFAHSLAARKQCVRMRLIVLLPFGAVSHTETPAATPGAQGIVAASGPLVSLLLGALCACAAMLFEPRSSRAFDALFAFAAINGTIALINSLPVYPFDGGNILRAVLWRITGHPDRASSIVAVLSALAGWIFALGSVALLVVGFAPFGMAAAYVAWLILHPVQIQGRADTAIAPAAKTRCIDLMDRPGSTLQPDVTCSAALRELIASGRRSAPVAVGRRFLGILALSDFAKLGDRDPDYVYTGGIMTPAEKLVTLEPATPGAEALQRLVESGYHQLPVVGKTGALLGFINRKAAD